MERKTQENKMKKQTEVSSQKGITLIALVVTIVVLLILAGVSISLVLGNNGIIGKAKDAGREYSRAEVEDDFSMLVSGYYMEKVMNDDTDFETYMKANGTDEVIDNGDGTYTVEYKGYEFTVDIETLEITTNGKANGVRPEFTVTKTADTENKKVTVKVEITNEVGSVDSIVLINTTTGEKITGTVSGKTGTFEVTKNGFYKVEVKATIEGTQKTGTQTVEINEIPVEFSTNYGRIEVVWLDKGNNVIEKPLAPVLNGLTPIKWNGTEETDTTESDSNWYNYNAISGTEDNRTSHWANAKNTDDGSYFVWIPRYAYRITYYASETSTEPTGYCDGRGIVKVDGTYPDGETSTTSMYKLDEGVQKVTKDGKSYIVHPAFETDVNLGGWSEELSGIWVAKYEMSNTNASDTSSGSGETFKSVPNVQSARKIDIGRMYTYSLDYDSGKESHMMKNSEWGAVAYLTHSQYGRNGHEIDINNSGSCITGNGGGSTDASQAPGITNAYDTPDGQKASSTGNICGIYDLSGGAWEFVAAFNDTDTKNYEKYYGSSFASPTNPSTEYATKYSNPTETNSGSKIYEVGKTGDATKEVYKGSGSKNWFSDQAGVMEASAPFLRRGGIYGEGFTPNGSVAGVFFSNGHSGIYDASWINFSFRVVLPGV